MCTLVYLFSLIDNLGLILECYSFAPTTRNSSEGVLGIGQLAGLDA